MLDEYRAQIAALDREEKQVVAQLRELVQATGSTLAELCGLDTRSVAELLVEVGDVRRFTLGGFGRFNGTAPLPASTAEGPGEPVRHRYNPAATAGSTRSCTAWRSLSCVASRAPRRSTPTRARRDTPRRRPAGSSNDTYPTSSTAA
ncbi:MAG: hypothetical protein ACLP01_02025 [Solirubrobacteraceae bacterium]